MWQKIPLKKAKLVIYFIALSMIIGGMYAKLSHKPLQDVTHEHALPWNIFEDSYRVLDGATSFHSQTLEKLRSLENKTIVLYGYMYPIKMAETHDHFLLSRQAHICQFHIPAHSGNMVEIIMKDSSLPYSPPPVLLKGSFSIPNDKELGITFRLEDAEVIGD